MNKRSLTVLIAGWILAVGYMLARGRTDVVTIGTDVLWPVIVLVLAWMTTRITETPKPLPLPSENRGRLFAQIIVIATVIVLTGIRGLNFHGVTAIWIPGWSPLLGYFGKAGAAIGMESDITNFGAYVLVPGVLALLLGARITEIGFARFAPRVAAVSVVWLLFPAVLWVVAIATHRATIPFMLFQLVRNFFSNGFSEEFLWRALFFTRLRGCISTESALWTQAALFGLWHFGYDYSASPNHDLLLMFADMFSSQVVLGYAFGWLMLRTRNIALPVVVHLAFDSLGDAFGAK